MFIINKNHYQKLNELLYENLLNNYIYPMKYY